HALRDAGAVPDVLRRRSADAGRPGRLWRGEPAGGRAGERRRPTSGAFQAAAAGRGRPAGEGERGAAEALLRRAQVARTAHRHGIFRLTWPGYTVPLASWNTRSGTSRSSLTSTTASRRWLTGSSS